MMEAARFTCAFSTSFAKVTMTYLPARFSWSMKSSMGILSLFLEEPVDDALVIAAPVPLSVERTRRIISSFLLTLCTLTNIIQWSNVLLHASEGMHDANGLCVCIHYMRT
jgi:hypothetical protein